jgi:thiol-disulfide isomerase/thioredoxin
VKLSALLQTSLAVYRELMACPYVVLLFLLCSVSVLPSWAADDFGAAAKLYLDGNIEEAKTAFEKLSKKQADNGRVHYHLGVCYMRLHDRENAEKEFDWIKKNSKDEQLQLLADAWLGRINRHRNNISDNYSIAPPLVAKQHGPVTKVFWFYTNWCPKCKRFRTVFEETQKQFKTVSFQKYNSEDPANWGLVSKYKVKSYPTLVYFDDKGKVIENYAAAPMGNTFAVHLRDLGAKAETLSGIEPVGMIRSNMVKH